MTIPTLSGGGMSAFQGFGLDEQFVATLKTVFDQCRAAGFEFKLSQGLRTPQKQAEYYCRWSKRTPADIDGAAAKMKKRGAPWLASVLLSYRDTNRSPKWLTDALPGAGWHQWGVAADCYCYRNGKMVENGGDPCYKYYAEKATALGLTAGYYFKKQDAGHVQGPAAPGATDVYTWAYIDSVMKERFGDKELAALAIAA
jgi:peptidoglycan LD-endopeptidase CwlK